MNPKLGRNDRCWCGSGKKYKRCHLDRETEQAPGKQEVLERVYQVYEDGVCLHPDADPSVCRGKIIKAHTIQRNGGLNKIARNGHVYSLLKSGRMFDESRWDPNGGPNRIGTKEASTFTGFCAWHDNRLFEPIEKEPFLGLPRQIALLGYRAICYELYMKKCQIAVSSLLRDSDKGKPLHIQRAIQEAIHLQNLGADKAIEELSILKSRYDEALFEERADALDYYLVEFSGSLEVMCSATAQATHDFRGNRIHDLGNLESPSGWLTFSLIATDDGGAAVFSWPSDHVKSADVIKTLHEIGDDNLPHAIIRFTFEFFENTYVSPSWWDALDRVAQASLKTRQLRDIGVPAEFPRPDRCLLDDGIRVVGWPVVSRRTSISD